MTMYTMDIDKKYLTEFLWLVPQHMLLWRSKIKINIDWLKKKQQQKNKQKKQSDWDLYLLFSYSNIASYRIV